MKLNEIKILLEAKLAGGDVNLEQEVYDACGSDMMSDVLAYATEQGVLITGLVNSQVIRTAGMMDMHCVVFVRSKIPTEEMKTLAQECGIVLMATKLRMYEACGILYASGLNRKKTQICDIGGGGTIE